MAFWIKETYAKVWDVEKKEKYTTLRISTSEKDSREEGKYINSNWFARCVGKANDPASALEKGDKIKITSGKISNESYKDKDGNNKSALNLVVFDFELMEATDNSAKSTSKPKTKAKTKTKAKAKDEAKESTDMPVLDDDEDEDELPF
jgi:single-stranded DNA-binding protein